MMTKPLHQVSLNSLLTPSSYNILFLVDAAAKHLFTDAEGPKIEENAGYDRVVIS